ncbi:alcohol dehydrogenase catalytic domain-containing protein [Streptomyces spinoverrucosus]|uniref:alcohol dehydrogenase catalytic domain-containing protein n=1 Tax=Streptomyces spinoverrucosus TaxID=284043 RepID=UPI0027DAB195|nr:alcohol dehydrogenase catalytic domain-containing protein [Streptomyces spinoverrucosus]
MAGVIAEIGDRVEGWSVGDRAAVGWLGGSCGHCAFCRVGDVVHCPERKAPGLSYPGGWARSITVPPMRSHASPTSSTSSTPPRSAARA